MSRIAYDGVRYSRSSSPPSWWWARRNLNAGTWELSDLNIWVGWTYWHPTHDMATGRDDRGRRHEHAGNRSRSCPPRAGGRGVSMTKAQLEALCADWGAKCAEFAQEAAEARAEVERLRGVLIKIIGVNHARDGIDGWEHCRAIALRGLEADDA